MRYAIDFVHPSRSMRPEAVRGLDGAVHDSIVALRIASWASRADSSSGTALIAASRPTCGLARDRVHRAERGSDEPRDRVVLGLERARPTIRPGPGSGVMASMWSTTAVSTVELELDRLVVGEAGRGVDGALLDRGTLREVGVLDDLDVARASARPIRAAPGA